MLDRCIEASFQRWIKKKRLQIPFAAMLRFQQVPTVRLSYVLRENDAVLSH